MAWTRDETFFPLPYKLKQDVVVYYLNKDIFEKNLRFFRSDQKMTSTLRGWTPFVANKKDDLMEPSFLYHFTCGLQPRMFDSKDNLDKIIFEEEAEVSEMYFFQTGQIGIAINQLSQKSSSGFFQVVQRRNGHQLIADHYIINNKRSNFIYIALESCHGYGISKKYVHSILDSYPDEKGSIRARTYRHYMQHTYKPVSDQRKIHTISKNMIASHREIKLQVKMPVDFPDCANVQNRIRDYIKKS